MARSAFRFVQGTAGYATGLLGFFIFIYIDIKDASLPAKFTEAVPTSTTVITFLMIVAPGALVAIGTFLQMVHDNDKVWPMILVCIAAGSNVVLTNLNPGLLYAMSADIWGQRLIIVDFIAVVLTAGTSVVNAILAILAVD